MNCRKFNIIIISLIFLLPLHNLGQSNFKISGGTKVKVTEETSVKQDNVSINNESQMLIRGDLTVDGNLINFAGTSGLIIKADENGSGSLLHNTTLVPATMEQYLTSERWHLVSSPITNSTIEPYLGIYLKQWNEPDSSWTYLVQPLSIPMTATIGYSAWASDGLTGTTTVNFEGNLNNGSYPVSLAYTPTSNATGWNLIGNPYPSAVEWSDDPGWNRSNVGGWAVIYDNATFRGWNPFFSGIDRSYNGKPDGIIPAAQGFWVRATDSPAYLTIPQNQRTHSTQIFYKDLEESNYMSLRLKATANGFEDETVIIMMTGASLEFDGLFDLEKFYNINEAPNIYTKYQGGMNYSVNVLPDDFISTVDVPVIPVGFRLGLEKECKISVTGVDGFDPNTPVYLEDLKENVMVDLRSQNHYDFYSHPSDDPNRFLLHFADPNTIIENSSETISIYSHQNCVYVRIPSGQKGNAEIFDVMGRKVTSFHLDHELTGQPVYKTGYYVIKVSTPERYKTKKVFIKSHSSETFSRSI